MIERPHITDNLDVLYPMQSQWTFIDDETLYYDTEESFGTCYDREKDLKRRKEYREFKKRNGYDPSESWNIGATIAKFALPRLAQFYKCEAQKSFPIIVDYETGKDMTHERWLEILSHIIDAFSMIALEGSRLEEYSQEEYEFMQKGAEYFGKYMMHIV